MKELFSFTIINMFLSYDVSRNAMKRFCHLVNNLVKLHKMIKLVEVEGNFPHGGDGCVVVPIETTEAQSPLYAPL